MNILIVDDEIYSVQGIVNALDWKSLGFKNVYTAYSMRQAQEIFESKAVDLLLTDIEMPKGSGFDLIKWTIERNYNPVSLFLTSYAKFDYAQQAIQLHCFGYILKPVQPDELKNEIQRAIHKINLEETQKSYQTLSKGWSSVSILQQEAFLRDLCSSAAKPENRIKAEALKCQMPTDVMEKSYYFVLVKAVLTGESIDWEKDLLNYAMRNILSELLCRETAAAIPDMGDNHFMVICDAKQFASDEAFLETCEKAAKECEKNLPGMFILFLSGRGSIGKASEYYGRLKAMENDSVLCGSFAVAEKTFREKTQLAPEIPVDVWSENLLTHNTSKILRELGARFHETYCTRPLLQKYYNGIVQTVYTALGKKNMEVGELKSSGENSENILQATESTEKFLQWAKTLLTKAESCLNTQPNPGSIVEFVRQYVKAHLNDDELTRSKIAAEIHLNPDYLSSIFREKSGQPLSLFIANARIEKAKKLLITTDLPIKDIYIQSGFSDISYFSKQFKQIVGVTPHQYRESVFKNGANPT